MLLAFYYPPTQDAEDVIVKVLFCLQFELGDVSGMHRHLMSTLKSVSVELPLQPDISMKDAC